MGQPMKFTHRLMIGAALAHIIFCVLLFDAAWTIHADAAKSAILVWGFMVALPAFWAAIDYTFKRHDDRSKPF